MDFIDQIRALAARVQSSKDIVQTEEATKTAMVMPFIHLLGYNVFDPTEVTPELVADVGTKKGEKVDYAILKDGKPIILFECKKCGADLNINHAGQLFRYFHVTEARFGVLTNGLVYRFFTDLDQPNKMDEKPFLEFNMADFKDQEVDELKKFAKAIFDVDAILTTANDLKYTRAIQNKLAEWMAAPSEEFVRLASAELIGTKRFTPAIRDQFTEITKRAFSQLIGDRINDRLRSAMTPEILPATTAPSIDKDTASATSDNTQGSVDTTREEIEGFYTVRAILRELVPSRRVVMRDAQSYCAILFDDNNRKPICRLRFNNPAKLVLALMNGKDEERVPLEDIDDIYKHAEKLKETVKIYLNDV